MSRQSTLGKTATSVRTDENGKTHIQYHETQVVSFDTDTVTLDSGDWKTATTKTRMNQAANQFRLGFAVFQAKGEWFVDVPSGARVPFRDGMTFARW